MRTLPLPGASQPGVIMYLAPIARIADYELSLLAWVRVASGAHIGSFCVRPCRGLQFHVTVDTGNRLMSELCSEGPAGSFAFACRNAGQRRAGRAGRPVG
jgi:hypothetical protein